MANGEIINEPIFKIKTFSGAAYSSLATNGSKNYSAANCNFEVPDGYEVFGIRYVSSGNYRVSLSEFYPVDETTRFIGVRNTYSSAQSGTPSMSVTFINKKYLEYGLRRNLSITAQEGITVNCSESNGTVLVGKTVTVTIDSPQTLNYTLYAEGLNVTQVRLNSENSYSYQFTMPDNDVSIEIKAMYILQTNVSPESAMSNVAISPTKGSSGSTPAGYAYYCQVGDTIKCTTHATASVKYVLQSAKLNGTDLELITDESSVWTEFVMPAQNSSLAVTLTAIPTT